MLLKIEDYLLPCLNKSLFGIDCPGCGFQRAVVFLFHGDFLAAFNIYPAIYTILVLLVFLLINYKAQFKKSRKIITILVAINLLVIVTSYFIKMKPIFNL